MKHHWFIKALKEKTGNRFNTDLVAPVLGWLASETCDVSGEVFVAGAGLLRRASAGESKTLSSQGDLAATVHTLLDSPLRTFANANDSYAVFLEELAAKQEED